MGIKVRYALMFFVVLLCVVGITYLGYWLLAVYKIEHPLGQIVVGIFILITLWKVITSLPDEPRVLNHKLSSVNPEEKSSEKYELYLGHAYEVSILILVILYSTIRIDYLIDISTELQSFQFGIVFFSAIIFALFAYIRTLNQRLAVVYQNVYWQTKNQINIFFKTHRIRYVISYCFTLIWCFMYLSELTKINFLHGYGIIITAVFFLVAAYTGREVFAVLLVASLSIGVLEVIQLAIPYIPGALVILFGIFVIYVSIRELIDVNMNYGIKWRNK